MNRLKHLSLLVTFAVALTAAQRSVAASVDLFNAASPFNIVNIGVPESRQTLLQVLQPVTLVEFGARLDPASSSQAFDWRVYASTAGASIGSVLYEQLGSTFNDVGFATYDTAVSVALDPGYYLLELFIGAGGNVTMQRFDDGAQGLPLSTPDGNFRVLDGFANPNTSANIGGTFANAILPAFSVTVAAVPLPAPFALLAAGLVLLPWRRRTA